MKNESRPSGRQLVALKDQVVKYFSESNWRELGAITDTLDSVSRHPRLLRSLSWHDDDYEGHALEMLKDIIDAAPRNYAIIMDYISRKCPEGGEFISSVDEGARRIVFTPNVFKVPDIQLDSRLVAVMMPFDANLKPVYDIIKTAATSSGHECLRADDIWEDSTIIQDVFSLIFRSRIVVCDFTGRNPNVFYEAGIAHTLGKHVIPIAQSKHDIPFDLRHHRHAIYLNNSEGLQVLLRDVSARIRSLSEQRIP